VSDDAVPATLPTAPPRASEQSEQRAPEALLLGAPLPPSAATAGIAASAQPWTAPDPWGGRAGRTPSGTGDSSGRGTAAPARRGGWWPGLLAGALAGALLGGGIAWAVAGTGGPERTAQAPLIIQSPQQATVAGAAAAKALPSVVTISVTDGSSGGSGSGIVLDAEGHILTNQHVATLAGATAKGAIEVMAADGRVMRATLVGQDPLYDLAVIKVAGDASGLTPVEWGDLSKLNVGDEAVAIGAPLGLPNSVSSGIVSNLDRSIPVASSAVKGGDADGGDERFALPDPEGNAQAATGQVSLNVIQTDAAINHGNSGGALVDASGALIGVNVAIFSPSEEGGSIGLGFSVRGDIARRVADELIRHGKASHGKLGVTIRSAPAGGSAGTGFTDGAEVADVPGDSPAGAAGLRAGDVIVKVGQKRVVDSTDVTATVRSYAAGTEVPFTVRRGGQERTVTVTLGEATEG